ncbi:MAG TPA: ECF transporter S component [Oscillospiraceae bacterium]|nr:ECF transporter S component [Oscillospiraceae bacterium]
MLKKVLIYLTVFLIAPAIFVLGFVAFEGEKYAFISLAMALAACLPFFLSFEKQADNAKKMIIIALMTALSVAGRFVFAPIPFFKPVTAIIVITAIYLGAEAGFLVGALTAVISNFYFGQGPWTPLQMLVWGLLGFVAGLISKPLLKSRLLLWLYGVLAGIAFSMLMDIWTVLWMDKGFNFTRYWAALLAAAPVTAVYAVSNVIFLALLTKPIGSKLSRVKEKYGI